jgi:predicted SAM-dependent methyltransferase
MKALGMVELMKMVIKKIINKLLSLKSFVCKDENVYDIGLYKEIFGDDSVDRKLFYNVGAGNFFHPAWTNIDKKSEWYGNESSNLMSWDLLSMSKVGLDDNSADIFYTSHTVEHITDEAAQNLFNEVYRTLKVGGIFRITMPNIDHDFRAYLNRDRNYFYWSSWYSNQKEMERVKINTPMNSASIQQLFLYHFSACVSTIHADGASQRIHDEDFDWIFSNYEYEAALNYCVQKCPLEQRLEIQNKYPGNHINWWNKDKTEQMLRKAGFTNVYLSGFGQSASPVLRNIQFFDSTHPKISLYMEAIKI